MKRTTADRTRRFRVWIAAYDDWRPSDARDLPPKAVALEPAEEGTMSGDQAVAYVEAFNRTAIERPRRIWAVALPVTVRYEGEPQAGETIEG